MKIVGLLLALVMSFGLITACSSNENDDGSPLDNLPSSSDRATAVSGDDNAPSQDERDEFEAEARDKLNDIETELSNAKARLTDANSEERQALERRIDELEQRRADLGDKIDEIRNGDNKDWEKLKDDLDKSMDDLRSDVKSAIDDLRN